MHPRHFNAIKVFSKKTKRTKNCVQYYSNYIAKYRIILSGDIEINPGPGLHKPKCQVSNKTVRCNQKRLVCEHCLEMCHVKCSNHQLNQNASNKAYEYLSQLYTYCTSIPQQEKFRFWLKGSRRSNHSQCK